MARQTRRMSKTDKRVVKMIVAVVAVLVTLNIFFQYAQAISTEEFQSPKEEAILAMKYEKKQMTPIRKNEPKVEIAYAETVSSVQTDDTNWRYEPTDEEFLYTCKLAFAEAGAEEAIGQTAVVEVALNSVEYGWASSIIEEFQRPYRYSSVINGIPQVPAYGGGFRPVTEDDLSCELKEAIRKAFLGERVTEQYLKEQALRQGLTDEAYWKGGALYFFNWNAIGKKEQEARNETAMPVRISIGHHTFARYWK